MAKVEDLTELELFKMALRMAETSINNTANALSVSNPEDLIFDRIMQAHSAIQRAAAECLGMDLQTEH